MELNEECLRRAFEAFDSSRGITHRRIEVAIKAYLAEMFKPGQVMTMEPLEAIPQRDYRKELWLDVATAVARSDGARDRAAPGKWADRALANFDKTFPAGPTNG